MLLDMVETIWLVIYLNEIILQEEQSKSLYAGKIYQLYRRNMGTFHKKENTKGFISQEQSSI